MIRCPLPLSGPHREIVQNSYCPTNAAANRPVPIRQRHNGDPRAHFPPAAGSIFRFHPLRANSTHVVRALRLAVNRAVRPAYCLAVAVACKHRHLSPCCVFYGLSTCLLRTRHAVWPVPHALPTIFPFALRQRLASDQLQATERKTMQTEPGYGSLILPMDVDIVRGAGSSNVAIAYSPP